jgi:hypothetical protein
MGRISITAILLALGISFLGLGTAAAELVPGGWLMPPRIPQAAPPPPPPAPAKAAPPAARRKAPPRRTRPANEAPQQRTAPSDGRVQF